MITIQQHPKLTDVADFIARLNSNSEHHIGYCGVKLDEILDALAEDFTDVPAEDAFVIATESNKFAGVCGFDADIERGKAEIWGPFIDHGDELQVAKMLWDSLIAKIPETIKTFSLFP